MPLINEKQRKNNFYFCAESPILNIKAFKESRENSS